MFELEVDVQPSALIKVVGVGGAGGNAVNRMIASGLKGVEFHIANTDIQALTGSLAPRKLQIGPNLTKGLGSGGDPMVGRRAAEEDEQAIADMLDGSDIVLQWRRTNMEALAGLEKVMRRNLRASGYPIILSRQFDKRTVSHQCGTVKMGNDEATSPLDTWCRAYQHRNLFVVDGGFLPTSAAVNPALTIAAQALRVADHIRRTELAA